MSSGTEQENDPTDHALGGFERRGPARPDESFKVLERRDDPPEHRSKPVGCDAILGQAPRKDRRRMGTKQHLNGRDDEQQPGGGRDQGAGRIRLTGAGSCRRNVRGGGLLASPTSRNRRGPRATRSRWERVARFSAEALFRPRAVDGSALLQLSRICLGSRSLYPAPAPRRGPGVQCRRDKRRAGSHQKWACRALHQVPAFHEGPSRVREAG